MRLRHPELHRGALPRVATRRYQLQLRPRRRALPHHLGGRVPTAVVDHDHLRADARALEVTLHLVEGGGKTERLVERRDDDRDLGVHAAFSTLRISALKASSSLKARTMTRKLAPVWRPEIRA